VAADPFEGAALVVERFGAKLTSEDRVELEKMVRQLMKEWADLVGEVASYQE